MCTVRMFAVCGPLQSFFSRCFLTVWSLLPLSSFHLAAHGSRDALVQAEPLETAVVFARDLRTVKNWSKSSWKKCWIGSVAYSMLQIHYLHIHALSLILSTIHVTHTTLHFPWVPHIRRLSPSTHAKDKFTLPGHLTHANDAQYVKLLQRFPLLGHVGPSYTASYLLSALWHGGQSWSSSQS